MFGEIYVQESRCQTAVNFFTKKSPKRFATRKSSSLRFRKGCFAILELKKVTLAVSDGKLVPLEVLRR